MPFGYESAARGLIFGMASLTCHDMSKHYTIPNIRSHLYIGIHIALQENDMTGASRQHCCTHKTTNNISAILVSRLFRSAQLELLPEFCTSWRLSYARHLRAKP